MDKFFINYENVDLIVARKPEFLDINRLNWRVELFLSQNRKAIEGQRILDLASNNGKFSYACLELGAKHVTGVEGRAHYVENANKFMSSRHPSDKWRFIQGDLFEYLSTVKTGEFDTILCFGFLYHTTKQVELFNEIKRIKPAHFILDTTVVKNYFSLGRRGFKNPPSLIFMTEDPTLDRMTIDESGIVAIPSKSFIEEMLRLHDFDYNEIDFRKAGIKNWAGIKDYKKGRRIAYIATRLE
jgi:SAM-dependent methyltransferase